jgi:hypothetical protein
VVGGWFQRAAAARGACPHRADGGQSLPAATVRVSDRQRGIVERWALAWTTLRPTETSRPRDRRCGCWGCRTHPRPRIGLVRGLQPTSIQRMTAVSAYPGCPTRNIRRRAVSTMCHHRGTRWNHRGRVGWTSRLSTGSPRGSLERRSLFTQPSGPVCWSLPRSLFGVRASQPRARRGEAEDAAGSVQGDPRRCWVPARPVRGKRVHHRGEVRERDRPHSPGPAPHLSEAVSPPSWLAPQLQRQAVEGRRHSSTRPRRPARAGDARSPWTSVNLCGGLDSSKRIICCMLVSAPGRELSPRR